MSGVQLVSDTLLATPSPGAIEYNGDFYATDSNSARAKLQRLVQGTAIATTSGTNADFTGIPAWAKKITVMFNGVSLSGTSQPRVQIGSGSYATSGYAGATNLLGTAGNSALSNGFDVQSTLTSSSNVYYGLLILTLLGANTWVGAATLGINNGSAFYSNLISGSIALSGVLDRLRITSVSGTDTFDAGSVNILIEG